MESCQPESQAHLPCQSPASGVPERLLEKPSVPKHRAVQFGFYLPSLISWEMRWFTQRLSRCPLGSAFCSGFWKAEDANYKNRTFADVPNYLQDSLKNVVQR